LAGLVYVTMRTVEAAGWGERVFPAPSLAVLGVGVGMLAAKSRLRSIWALPIGIGIGLESVVLSQALTSPGPTWAAKLGWVSDTLSQWLDAALTRGATHDPLVLGSLLSGIGYMLGLCSSWLVFRLQNGWWPLIFNATVGLVHLSYTTVESVPPYLASLLIGVLMVASLELYLRRSIWRAIGIPVQGGSTVWTLGSAAMLAGLGLFLGLRMPAGDINAELAARYQALTEPWRDFQRQVDRLTGGGKGQSRSAGTDLAFPDRLEPREDFDLGSQPVLRIVAAQPSYSRTATYDRYDGRSMAASGAAERHYEANQPLPADPESGRYRSAVEQKITILAPSAAAIFALDSPRSFSLPVILAEREVGWDVAAMRPSAALQRGQSYGVTSDVLVVGRRQLAEAPSAYPAWTERYIDLPASLPPRVGALANQLAEEAENPFERALAIESYLRGLTYSTHTTVPPPERDWVDFLLFESRSGYCDYFATAMAVMLRTQGIPARVASGFAPGVYDPQERAWLVRESEAHSWTEAYFPEFGWLTFEPSAIRAMPGRPETARGEASSRANDGVSPEALLQDDERGALPGPPREPLVETGPTPTGLAIGALGTLVLVAGLGVAIFARVWEGRLEGEPPARRRYAHLRRCLRWGGWQLRDSSTPYELATALGASFPRLKEPIGRLVTSYVEVTYRRGATPTSADDAEAAWRSLRGPLTSAMLRRRLRRTGIGGK
jgi:transglutaminase-like putative cysteine protease